jgi:transmembrane sensor
MSPAEFKNLLDRYFHGDCTSEEVAFIEKWYANINENKDLSPSEESQIQQRIWADVKPVREIRSFNYWKYAAAAAIAILASIPLFIGSREVLTSAVKTEIAVVKLNDQLVEVTNNTSSAHDVNLSDGSVVILAPHSTLRHPEHFSKDQRHVELTGEAFFKVKRDASKPFIVHSKEIITKVLGTSFRITAFEDSKEIVVAVKTGKVSVSPTALNANTLKDVILTPNQQIIYNRAKEKLIKQVVPAPVVVAADSATYFTMQFDGMPVGEIFDVLQENYGIEIQYDKEILSACVLTTKMTEEGFYDRIKVICKAINAEYTNIDGVVVITGKGCQ